MDIYDFNRKLNTLLKGSFNLKSDKGKAFVNAYNSLLNDFGKTSFTEKFSDKENAYIKQIILMFKEHPDLDDKSYEDYIKFCMEEILKSKKKVKSTSK